MSLYVHKRTCTMAEWTGGKMETAIGWPGCDFDERRHTPRPPTQAASARAASPKAAIHTIIGESMAVALLLCALSPVRRNSIFVHIKIKLHSTAAHGMLSSCRQPLYRSL